MKRMKCYVCGKPVKGIGLHYYNQHPNQTVIYTGNMSKNNKRYERLKYKVNVGLKYNKKPNVRQEDLAEIKF